MVLLPGPCDGWKELPEAWNTLLTEPVHQCCFIRQIIQPRPFPPGHAKENQEMFLTSEGFKGREKEAEV